MKPWILEIIYRQFFVKRAYTKFLLFSRKQKTLNKYSILKIEHSFIGIISCEIP